MNIRGGLALVAAVLLAASALPISAAAQTGSSSSLTLTVNPDGSLGLTLVGNSTTVGAPGQSPTSQFSGNVTTANGESKGSIQGSLTLPSYLTSQPPYNYGGSISGSGNYSNGQSQGKITYNAASGVSSPFSSFTLNSNGNSHQETQSGSLVLNYGTYSLGGGQTIELNQTSISQLISLLEQEGFNQTALNREISSIPPYAEAGVQVTTFSITPTYGSSSATVDLNFVMTGNFTALVVDEFSYYCSTAGLNASVAASCQSEATLFNSFYSGITSQTYSFGYTGGVLDFQGTVVGPSNFDAEAAIQAAVKEGPSSGMTAAQKAFWSSTTVDISSASGTFSMTQSSSGAVRSQFTLTGMTLRPTVKITGGQFNESAFFNAGGTTPENNTIVTAAGVTMNIPSGVPQPNSRTSNSATWVNVEASSLAGLTFGGGSTSTTTSAPGSSSGGGIPEFPFQLLGVAAFTALLVVSYLFMRKRPAPGPR